MSDTLPDAVLRPHDGLVECVLPLAVDQPPAAVWRALTDTEALPQWLAEGSIEPRVGGSVDIAFEVSGAPIGSTVEAWIPDRHLAYSWSGPGQPARPLDWRLAPTPAGGTRIELTVSAPAEEDLARAFAGWAAHLQMLGGYLAGVPIAFPFQHFKAVREALGERLAAGRTVA